MLDDQITFEKKILRQFSVFANASSFFDQKNLISLRDVILLENIFSWSISDDSLIDDSVLETLVYWRFLTRSNDSNHWIDRYVWSITSIDEILENEH
jgi:hypothetical protein